MSDETGRELAIREPQTAIDLRNGRTKFSPDEAFEILNYRMQGNIEKTDVTGEGAKLAEQMELAGLAPRRKKKRVR
jgi:hypothetical protein